MLELEYVNVNEEGEEYDVHDSLNAALAVLNNYPNDTIVIRYKPAAVEEQFSDDDARDLTDDLDNLLDRFDELMTVAGAHGYAAVQHKLEEAAGPLRSGRDAAEQYATGILKRHDEGG